LSEAFRLYAQDVIIFRNQSRKTEENHYVCMKALIVFFDDVEIGSLTFPMIRDWKIALEKNRSPLTVRNYIIRLRVVLEYLTRNGEPCLDPNQVPVPKRTHKVPEYITKEEVAQLISAVSKPSAGYYAINRIKNAAVISALYSYGLRVSELCQLNIADIKEDGSFTVVGKGGKARLCFMDERTLSLIASYLAMRKDNHPALFLSEQSGERLTPANIQFVFRLARKKAGFTKPIHPHTLRHSFATDLLKNNTNIRYVQAMLGHSSLETTQMYTHVVNEDLRKVYKNSHTY